MQTVNSVLFLCFCSLISKSNNWTEGLTELGWTRVGDGERETACLSYLPQGNDSVVSVSGPFVPTIPMRGTHGCPVLAWLGLQTRNLDRAAPAEALS